jgi:hypothetical protein
MKTYKHSDTVIPAQAGIQPFKSSAQQTKPDVDPLRGIRSINWIPACAGMTDCGVASR